MRILIADDEPFGLKRLRSCCEKLDQAVVAEARNGQELMALAAQEAPEVILTDIDMPLLNGVDAVRALGDPRPAIIFATGHGEFAAIAFELDAADFILKPVQPDRLKEALRRAVRRREARQASWQSDTSQGRDHGLWVSTRRGNAWVAASSIDWIEAAGDYAMIHTPVRSYLHRATMTALEQILQGSGLHRVHRSALVRLSNVVEVSRSGRALEIVLRDGAIVSIGGMYAQAVLDELKL